MTLLKDQSLSSHLHADGEVLETTKYLYNRRN